MAEPLFVTLYIDADVTPKLARLLRERGFDAISAHEVGNAELTDQENLAYAVGQGRAILTYNSKDFAPLFDEYWWTGREHHGIIVSEQLPLGELLRRILRLLNTVTADEMRNSYKDLAQYGSVKKASAGRVGSESRIETKRAVCSGVMVSIRCATRPTALI